MAACGCRTQKETLASLTLERPSGKTFGGEAPSLVSYIWARDHTAAFVDQSGLGIYQEGPRLFWGLSVVRDAEEMGSLQAMMTEGSAGCLAAFVAQKTTARGFISSGCFCNMGQVCVYTALPSQLPPKFICGAAQSGPP